MPIIAIFTESAKKTRGPINYVHMYEYFSLKLGQVIDVVFTFGNSQAVFTLQVAK